MSNCKICLNLPISIEVEGQRILFLNGKKRPPKREPSPHFVLKQWEALSTRASPSFQCANAKNLFRLHSLPKSPEFRPHRAGAFPPAFSGLLAAAQ